MPDWPHAVELQWPSNGHEGELTDLLEQALGSFFTVDDWAAAPWPIIIKRFRLRTEAEAFAARFTGVTGVRILNAALSAEVVALPFDYWQR